MQLPVKRNSKGGYILLPVVLLLGLVTLVAFLLGYEGTIGRYLTLQRAEPERALYVAEAGLQYATWHLQQANCVNYADITTSPFGDNSFTATISPHYGSPVDITATGTLAGGTSRSLAKKVRALETPMTEILQPDGATMQDTWIYQWKPTWNYGADTQIGVDTYYAYSDANSLLKFDLSAIAPSVRIINATLELYMNSPSDNGGPVGVHQMTRTWNEGTGSGGTAPGATWNVSASGVPWTTPGGDFNPVPVTVTNVTPYTAGWNGWDLTSLVSDWVSGVTSNHGLMLKMQVSGRAAYFHSSDYSNAALRPKLTITYACECGSGASQQLILQPGTEGKDSYVQNKSNDPNHGLLENLSIQNTWDQSLGELGLLGFDLSGVPAGALITSAQLSLYAHSVNTGFGGTDITVHRSLVPWTESGVTYQTADGSTPWTWPDNFEPVPESAVTFFKDNLGWHTWDLTDLVIKWHTAFYPNYGLFLQGETLTYFVQLYSSEYSDPALRPKLTINYACPCGVDCSGGSTGNNLLFVAASLSPTAQEQLRIDLIESWGYTVTLIADDDTQANFDAVAAVNDAAYVSQEISAGSLGTKLVNTTIGVVNESKDMIDDFGFASGLGMGGGMPTLKVNLDHYITSVFSANPVSPYVANEWYQIANVPVATGVDPVGTWVESPWSGRPALMTLPQGADLISGGTAAGRRVQIPWGSGQGTTPVALNSLSDDARTIIMRSIEWAAGAGSDTVSGPQTQSLPSSADTRIEQATDVNYGAETQTQTGQDVSGNLQRTMIKFDVSSIPAGATVVSATLRLYVESRQGITDSNVGLYSIVTDWEESSVTWNSSGGGGFDPASLAEPLVEWSIGWKEWDVPPGLVHEWIDGVTDNYGLLLDYLGTKKNNILRFATKEHTDPARHPQLVIEYIEP